MTPIETPRLRLRPMSPDADVAFIQRLLNEESFLRFIGDRGVRTPEDARAYILTGPLESYARHGFGLLLTERRSDSVPIGMCGLLKRESLEAPDLGFAFVPEAWGQGLAFEAAEAVLAEARMRLGLRRVLAVTQPDNRASIRLLERLGFGLEGAVRLSADGPELALYAIG
jgi:RimJ/RimL family protein N-acetyltransferase